MIKFEVGDRVAVYGEIQRAGREVNAGIYRRVGTIRQVQGRAGTDSGSNLLIEITKYPTAAGDLVKPGEEVWAHSKQCRRLKKKEPPMYFWAIVDQDRTVIHALRSRLEAQLKVSYFKGQSIIKLKAVRDV